MVSSLRQKLVRLAEEDSEPKIPWEHFKQLEHLVKIAWAAKSTELWQEFDRKISLMPEKGSDMAIVRYLTSGSIYFSYPEKAEPRALRVEVELNLPYSIGGNKAEHEEGVIKLLTLQIWHEFVKTYMRRAVGLTFGDDVEWEHISLDYGDGWRGARAKVSTIIHW